YIFLWFWFYFLAIVSALALLYRALTIFVPRFRVMTVAAHCRISSPRDIRKVLRHGTVGDWFLLDLLAKNMEPANFRDLILNLKEKLGRDRSSIDSLKDKLYALNQKLSIMEKR